MAHPRAEDILRGTIWILIVLALLFSSRSPAQRVVSAPPSIGGSRKLAARDRRPVGIEGFIAVLPDLT